MYYGINTCRTPTSRSILRSPLDSSRPGSLSLLLSHGTLRSLTVLLQAADVREDRRADAVAAGDSTNEDAEPTSRAIANTTMFMEKFILLSRGWVGVQTPRGSV